MNKTALKNFAIAARLELLQRVMNRANLYGVNEETCKSRSFKSSSGFQKLGGELLSREEESQRDALIRRVNQQGYRQTMEEAAYTWFNRLIALRYMQEHQLLPVSQRVLPEIPGQMPEIIREAHQLSLDGVDSALVLDLLDRNETTTLYRYLLISLCNALHDPLPMMFERISDYTELLFPDGLLKDDSVLAALAKIPAEDFQDIQVIGWLYQYYNTELKNETFELLKKNVKITKERIGAATQLFTPEWIVRYMVQNSLGRLWLEGHPEESLRMKWRYYMDEAQQEPEVAAKLAEIRQGYASMQLEDIRLLDPCMGSGHILVYAFDMLMEIYRTMGYTDRDAVRSIVENNLYGLDIDDRAAQLAYFAVMMKACEYDRRFLRREIQPHVCAMQESYGMPEEAWEYFAGQKNTAQALYRAFEHAKDFGSLIAPDVTPTDLMLLESQMEEMARHAEYADLATQATIASALAAMQPLMEQARILVNKYDVVVTNPPYMGSSGMNDRLSKYVKDNYPDSKSDLFAVFMERGIEWVKQNGFTSMITMESWMFLSSFEKLRSKVINETEITTLVHMPYLGKGGTSLGINFGTAATVVRNCRLKGYTAAFDRICYYETDEEGIPLTFPVENEYYKHTNTANFTKIPGMPVAYWVSTKFLKIFSHKSVSNYAEVQEGLKTGDNERFIRKWYEIDINTSNIKNTESPKWVFHTKGGNFRKWYGNQEDVLNYGNSGRELRSFKGSSLTGWSNYFKENITYSRITSAKTSFRYTGAGSIPNMAGLAIYPTNEDVLYILAWLNTNLVCDILYLTNPTINFPPGTIARLPIAIATRTKQDITAYTQQNIDASKADWDSFETSWDFKKHPLLPSSPSTLASCYAACKQTFLDRFTQLKANEEELNRIFIDINGLQGELTPEVADKDVTVYRIIDQPNEEERKMAYVLSMRDEIVSLLSYIVGCMLGRYSPYVDGLLYAGGAWDYAAVCQRIAEGAKNCDFYDESLGLFLPDKDGIVPITDDEYFGDDIVSRTVDFIRKVYGADTLDENLRFIATALGNKGATPQEVLRNYYLKDFYTDHLRTYQKRPIYWQFDSGKQDSLKCLSYLHRYDQDTIARIRTDYVHELQDRLRVQLEDAQRTAESGDGRMRTAAVKRVQKLEKQLIEMGKYEEIVHHYADMRIALDLDDGVKVNYAKLAELLTKIK